MPTQTAAYTNPMVSAMTSASPIMPSPSFNTMDAGVRITYLQLQQMDAIQHAQATLAICVVETACLAT